MFSLVSTILGGGVLTLPFAFAEAGIVPGSLLLVAVAAASDFSAFTLAVCCRRGAAHTFEDVAALAFGARGRTLSMILVILLTFLALIAYRSVHPLIMPSPHTHTLTFPFGCSCCSLVFDLDILVLLAAFRGLTDLQYPFARGFLRGSYPF